MKSWFGARSHLLFFPSLEMHFFEPKITAPDSRKGTLAKPPVTDRHSRANPARGRPDPFVLVLYEICIFCSFLDADWRRMCIA
jgi:hypothetical protein